MNKFFLLLLLVIGASQPRAASSQGTRGSTPGDTPHAFRESFTRHYPLERSPRIEIVRVGGPVVISAGRAGAAEITVRRSAATQLEFDCHQVKIDHRPDLIRITTVQFFDRPGCRMIRASQALTLRVPSDALLQLSQIGGDLQITGPVRGIEAESVAGHASITAAGTVKLLSLAKGLSLRLGDALPGTATITSVMGDVELDVAERRNVEIRLSSFMGEIKPLPPGFARLRTNEGYMLRSGAGGASLWINSMNGDVIVRRQ